MLNHIDIKSFKSFNQQKIDLSRLTLLAGFNNSGKSTAMQAVRIGLGQKIDGSFMGGMGGYEELKSRYSPIGDDVRIEIIGEDNRRSLFIWGRDAPYSLEKSNGCPVVEFISADRFGPRVELPLMSEYRSDVTVGERGEHSAHYAHLFENCIVREPLLHPNSQSRILKHQLIAWMGEISPGVRLEFDIQRKFDSSRLEVNGSRAVNSGYGISYVLPIILTALVMTADYKIQDLDKKAAKYLENIAAQSAILLVENPEAHLHPRGQTLLGKLLALACTQGIQIVVESHSDHFLDGLRIAMKNCNELNEKDLKIYFFSKDEESASVVNPIELKKNGTLSEWPIGFFDQMAKNLRELTSKSYSS